MKKSLSMDCLPYVAVPSPSSSTCSSSLLCIEEAAEKMSNGYISDGLLGRAQERKKGVPWTEDEHRAFLAGLEKLGKGDWRGISRHFVLTRTPSQVASHAQKYFLRQNTLNKKKRRGSLFDVMGIPEIPAQVKESSKTKEHFFFSNTRTAAAIDLNTPGAEARASGPDLELSISFSTSPLLGSVRVT
ncbi:hypothetical protein HPP92_026510 [Vanilla planifolia]|uniref:Uncharacterized protein n=1 Tax=Vanilla planifolia TaxID=51239 RepID=A0A835PF87_VANPL|nr:hypothetical protein HPP92_026510 [Vanilla planifolia]